MPLRRLLFTQVLNFSLPPPSKGFIMYFLVKLIPVHWLVVPDCVAFPRDGADESPDSVAVPDIGEDEKKPIIIFSHGVSFRVRTKQNCVYPAICARD